MPRLENRDDFGLEWFTVYDCVPIGHIDVQLAPDPEFPRNIDARLNRETGASEDRAFLARFKVVHIGAVSVGFSPDAMPRAVAERRAKAGRFDHAPGGIVHLPTLERLPLGEGIPHPGNGRVPGPGQRRPGVAAVPCGP